MSIGFWQILLIVIVVLIVFGAGKLPKVMGDFGKGVRNLRDELSKDSDSNKKE